MASDDSPKVLSRQERRRQERDRVRAQAQFRPSQRPAQARGQHPQQQRQRQDDLRRAIGGPDQLASPAQREAGRSATIAAASHQETEITRASVRQGVGTIVELAQETIEHAQNASKRYREFFEHAKRERCTIIHPQRRPQSQTSSSSSDPRPPALIIHTKDPILLPELEKYISSASHLVESWAKILTVLNDSAFVLRHTRRVGGRALADPTAARLGENYEQLAQRVRESVAGMREVQGVLGELEAGLKRGLREVGM